MLDISAAREAFRVLVVSDIGLFRTEENLVDRLNKHMKQNASRYCVHAGKFPVHIFQSIVRTHGHTNGGNRITMLNVADKSANVDEYTFGALHCTPLQS